MMKKKTFIIFIILLLLFTFIGCNPVYASTTINHKLISITLPNRYSEDYISDFNDDEYIYSDYNGNYANNDLALCIRVHGGYIGYRELTNSDISIFTKAIEDLNDSSNYKETKYTIISANLTTISGVKAIKVRYKSEITYKTYGITAVVYGEEYVVRTDHTTYTINIAIENSVAYLDSTEYKKMINSIKIKDTVVNTRGIPFTDVATDAWYNSSVKYCYNNKMISGISNYSFEPETKLTRGMLVTILHNMEGSPYVAGTCKFSDVKNTNDYYYVAVKWATQNNIVSGYNNGKFGPNDPITREQLAVILNNYCKYKGKYKAISADLSSYKDANKISEFAKWGMNWAVGSGVITGNANSKTLNPQGATTRAEATSMLYKYCLNIK